MNRNQIIEALSAYKAELSALSENVNQTRDFDLAFARFARWRERLLRFATDNLPKSEAEEIDTLQLYAFTNDEAGDFYRLVKSGDVYLTALIEELNRDLQREVGEKVNSMDKTPTVFIGHGRNPVWMRLQLFLQNDLRVNVTTFENEERAGRQVIDVLNEMLNKSDFAFLVLTGEDETADNGVRARQNVIHEVGLFQGRLGFTKAIILLEEGVEKFSNAEGLQYIPFPKGNIDGSRFQIQQVLKREGIIT